MIVFCIGLWSEAVGFDDTFTKKSTTYDLTTYTQWNVKDVGTGKFVRLTSYGTNGFQLLNSHVLYTTLKL